MDYTAASYYFNYQHPSIQALISPYQNRGLTKVEQAKALYLRVRDGWKYNPYHIKRTPESFKASTIAAKTEGHCIEKSVLLIACLRGLGIPARLHLGKVKNHIAVERLVEKFGTNELAPHGMVNAYLNGQWLKLSPVFNQSLCARYKVAPLDFDGENSSYLQAYNEEGSMFMEYVEDYGSFNDVPLEFINDKIKEYYPHIFDVGEEVTEFRL